MAISAIQSRAATKREQGLCVEDALGAMWKVFCQLTVFHYIPIKILQHSSYYIMSMH